MEIIKTIALLCQLKTSQKIDIIEKKQLQCQQYYINCLDNPTNYSYKSLSSCIKKEGYK